MNVTVIVALITAISAIFAPVITSWQNNRHQLKMKEIEIYHQRKIEVIEGYLKSTSQYLSLMKSSYESDYNAMLGKIYLYTSPSIWPKIDLLHSYISFEGGSPKDFTSARTIFSEARKELSKYLALG